jgi:hypothetical protein
MVSIWEGTGTKADLSTQKIFFGHTIVGFQSLIFVRLGKSMGAGGVTKATRPAETGVFRILQKMLPKRKIIPVEWRRK